MRKTKIICTLGPATDSPEVLARLIAAGANVFRLNMSHGTHEWVRTVVPRIREVARQTSANIAIMMDTQGPAIRTGDVATNLDLHPGDVVEFTVRGAKSEEHYSVDVNYDGLIDDIHDGDVVMVDNGNIHMKVLAKKENRVQCEVLTQGVLGSRRHINLPGVKVNLPPMTEKDLKDIVVGVETEVDYFALSFCRERSDVDAMRAELKRLGSDAHIIAKIEDQHAVKHVKEIIDAADAIMLSGETSVGKYPVQCVETFDRVARRIERSGGAGFAADAVIDGPRQKTVAAAVSLANNFPQAKMVVFTFQGTMALYVSHLRPLHAPIFAFSPDERVCRRLALLYGVHAQRMGFVAEPDKNVFAAETALLLKGLAEPGDHLVVVTDILDGDRRHESVQLRIVP